MTTEMRMAAFTLSVQDSLKTVEALLDKTKHPVQPHCIQHVYEDKYIVIETVINFALYAIDQVFTQLQCGDSTLHWPTVKDWIASGHRVTLQLSACSSCQLNKKETKSVGDDKSKVTTVAVESGDGKGRNTTTTVNKTLTEVTEWYWDFTHTFELCIFSARNIVDKIILQSRTGSTQLVTTTEASPHPQAKTFDPIDVDITEVIQLLKGKDFSGSTFKIDRRKEDCYTPCRNKDIETVMNQFKSLSTWGEAILKQFSPVFEIGSTHVNDHGYEVTLATIIKAQTRVFLPVIPMLVKTSDGEDSYQHFSYEDTIILKQEQQASFEREVLEQKSFFLKAPGPLTSQEAILCLCLQHLCGVSSALADGLFYMEEILGRQVVAAIGKHVQSRDISEYVDFHNRKLFKREYAPQHFQFDVRRGRGHAPEGIIAIERCDGIAHTPYVPIITHTKSRLSDDAPPMTFPLNAAKRVEFRGEHFLHGYVQHKFSSFGNREIAHRLTARAQQFSSFVLMVGRIVAFDCFQPQHAIIIKDKDEVILPLELSELPTRKEFNDAISSLSPEQQDFCRALRAMQLESTLFALLVVQIKPQLENLLRLPGGALTKEIQLSQDLMQLFIDYQVPSDLLTYDGNPKSAPEIKLTAVKEHVKALQDMIEKQKEKELKDAKQDAHAAFFDERGAMNTSGAIAHVKTAGVNNSNSRKGKLRVCYPAPTMMMSGHDSNLETVMMHDGHTNTTTTSSQPSGAVPPIPPRNWNIQGYEEEIVDLPDEGFLGLVDYTKVPITMDSSFQSFDKETAIRPTTINVENSWKKKTNNGLLRKSKDVTLNMKDQKMEKNRAMDLIDALSRSGDLSLEKCELHIVVGVTHCFDCSVMEAVTQKGINPIEKIERSAIVVAETIHEQPASKLLSVPFHARIMRDSTVPYDKDHDEKKETTHDQDEEHMQITDS